MTIVRNIALALAGTAMTATPVLAQTPPSVAMPVDDDAPAETVAVSEAEPVEAEAPLPVESETEVAAAPVEAEPPAVETTPVAVAAAEPVPEPAPVPTEPARAKASFTEKAAVAMGTLAAAFAAYQAFKDAKKKPAAPAQ